VKCGRRQIRTPRLQGPSTLVLPAAVALHKKQMPAASIFWRDAARLPLLRNNSNGPHFVAADEPKSVELCEKCISACGVIGLVRLFSAYSPVWIRLPRRELAPTYSTL